MQIKTYDVIVRMSMPSEVVREGQPPKPVDSVVVTNSMEKMLRSAGVDLIAIRTEEVTAIDEDE